MTEGRGGALVDRFVAALGPVETPLGLAVSGGGDSVALLRLAVAAGLPVAAVTVDHGLRAGSAAEADWVGGLCAGLGVPHAVLRWTGWDGAGNLQDQARRARLRLIGDWARAAGIGAVALAHTRDDQAETVLMRIARGAGVDGLSAMQAVRLHLGVRWVRPLLGVGCEELRDHLRGLGQGWIEDPSNDALRFDRVKARRALAVLAPLGITGAGLADLAGRMAEARDALEAGTLAAARTLVRIEAGDVVIARPGFEALPMDLRRRLLARALLWVASAEYGPRGAALGGLIAALAAGQGGTLAGCRVLLRKTNLRVVREAAALRGVVAEPGAVWDGRWRVFGPEISGLQVRALGDAGLSECPGWRDQGGARAGLLASPAVWHGDRLVAAPLARAETDWRAELCGGDEGFFLSVLSH